MPGTKSISEVRDLYDLIEFYGNLDKNADGLLGPDEVSAEEIAAGDRGGIGSANADVKDGFLSPWEVMLMRGFPSFVAYRMRNEVNLKGRTFPDRNQIPCNFQPCMRPELPGIQFSGFTRPEEFRFVIRAMKNLAPALRECVHTVHLSDDENLDAIGVERRGQEGAAHADEMAIVIRRTSLQNGGFGEEDFLHESAHLLSYRCYRLDNKFQEEWRAAAGDVYDRYVLPRTEHGGDGGWQNRRSRGLPQFGCMNSYGNKDFLEDVATFAEAATFEPGRLRELIDPDSAYYRDYPDQAPFVGVYRKKLDLLLRYGFITQKEYGVILPLELIPPTPEFDEARNEARKTPWRIAVHRGLADIWPSLTPEQRQDPVLAEVLAEEGREAPSLRSGEMRFGFGPSFDRDGQGYLHAAIDLRWKPVHLFNARLNLGVMAGLDADLTSKTLDNGHTMTRDYASARFGGVITWSPSPFILGVTPFVSRVAASRKEDYYDEEKKKTVTVSDDHFTGTGIGMELSAQWVFGTSSPYSNGDGFYSRAAPGLFASYAYRRLLGREKEGFSRDQHQTTAGFAILF